MKLRSECQLDEFFSVCIVICLFTQACVIFCREGGCEVKLRSGCQLLDECRTSLKVILCHQLESSQTPQSCSTGFFQHIFLYQEVRYGWHNVFALDLGSRNTFVLL